MENKMQKIVINTCYGGFGSLSKAAVHRAVELGWVITEGYNDQGNYINPKAEVHYGTSYSINEENVKRDNKVLVQLIKELGKDISSCTNYKVVEIPDDVKWIIEDYDGIEWVAEKHRTWD